jgi:hypothetical protein
MYLISFVLFWKVFISFSWFHRSSSLAITAASFSVFIVFVFLFSGTLLFTLLLFGTTPPLIFIIYELQLELITPVYGVGGGGGGGGGEQPFLGLVSLPPQT